MLSAQQLNEKNSVESINKELDRISQQLIELENSNSGVRHSIVPPHISQQILDSYMDDVKEIENSLQRVINAKKQLEGSTEALLISQINKRIEEIQKKLKMAQEKVEAQRKANQHMDEIRAARNKNLRQQPHVLNPSDMVKAQKESMECMKEARQNRNKPSGFFPTKKEAKVEEVAAKPTVSTLKM